MAFAMGREPESNRDVLLQEFPQRGLQSYLSSVLFHSTEKIKERGGRVFSFWN
jgi:hypothetical protein